MPKRLNLQNQRFGRLVAIEDIGVAQNGARIWRCKCDCGNLAEVMAASLKNGNTKSCGCYRVERTGKMRRAHGMSGTLEHNIWKGMHQRCSNPNNRAYQNYGGRGIEICSEWKESFETFYADMGNRPDGYTLDRIDNDGNYSKDNCRWATREEQMRNTRRTRLITHNRETKCIAEWARDIGLRSALLRYHLDRGLSMEQIIGYRQAREDNV